MTLARPEAYFRNGGECPERVSLCVASRRVQQPGRVQSAIANRVAQAHHKMRVAARAFVGRASVLAQSFVKRARSFEPKRVLVPTVAAKNQRPRKALLAIKKAFRIAYRQALGAWKAGVRDSVFPFGTWRMRVHHRARSEPQPATG